MQADDRRLRQAVLRTLIDGLQSSLDEGPSEGAAFRLSGVAVAALLYYIGNTDWTEQAQKDFV